MRIFGGEQVSRLMSFFKLPEDVPLEHGMVSKAIEQAQIKVEGFHFDSRKHLVEYDDVINKHREIIYKERRGIVEGKNLKDEMLEKLDSEVASIVGLHSSPKGSIDREQMVMEFASLIPYDDNSRKQLLTQLEQENSSVAIEEFLKGIVNETYEKREKDLTEPVMRHVERWVNLSVIDNLWMDHLTAIDDLREGIGLRGYGQRDPLIEYKNEAFSMFERLMAAIDYEVTRRIFRVHVHLAPEQLQGIQQQQKTTVAKAAEKEIQKRDQKVSSSQAFNVSPPIKKKLGRNDPCPCGSGKKWKKCHYPNIP